MAVSIASPSASPSPSAGEASTNSNNNNTNNNSNNNATGNNDSNDTKNKENVVGGGGQPASAKRKPSRRANTAERRATHNAVERQRRETLNGRFLDLAALLPNLSQIRRPSKSSIVNSSIAHVHASRRHRLLASRELRMLRGECDALRREVNEWRSRNNLPPVEEPVQSEAFNIIVSGELDVLMAEMGAEMAAQGHGNLGGTMGGGSGGMDEDEDIDDWGPAPPASHGGAPPAPPSHSSHGSTNYPSQPQYADNGAFAPQPPVHHHHAQHHPVHHQQHPSMMMNNQMHGHGHPSQMHPQHPQQMHQQSPFGYHPSPVQQFQPSPFAHNVPRSYEGGPNAQNANGALFTPPATRDGLPPNGVAGLTKGSMSVNTNGSASPTHSAHSAHSPPGNGAGDLSSTPPPQSAVSQQFGGRAGSGSPVGYEMSSGSANGSVNGGKHGQPTMERRSTYPGPGGAMMYAGGQGEMYGAHPMHGPAVGMQGHDMRMAAPMGAHGGHHASDMRMGGHGQMVGAGAGGALFGMML